MVNNLDLINNYLEVTSISSTSFLAKFLKAYDEFYLDDFYHAKISVTELLKLKVNKEIFPSVLALSILTSNFKDLMSYKYIEEFLDIDDVLVKFFKDFYNNYKYGTNVDWNKSLNELNKSETGNKSENGSIGLFLISESITNKDEKIKCLETALELCKYNFSAAKSLYLKGAELEIDILKNLYLIEYELFTNYKNTAEGEDKDYNIEFLPLGGGSLVGASSYYMKLENTEFIIDAGIRFHNDEKVYPAYNNFLEKVQKAKFCIITHAHLDHCGAILKLREVNRNIKFFMTEETRKIIKYNINLPDTSEDDVNTLDYILGMVNILEFNQKYKVNDNLSIEFYKAGHVLGAASIMIRTSTKKIFVTGDFLLDNQLTVEGAKLPDEEIDILITENTYGNKDMSLTDSINKEHALLKKYVIDGINDGRNILIPAFAIGRSQEIIKILEGLANEYNFRIYVDGDSTKLTKVFQTMGLGIDKRKVHFVNNNYYKNKRTFIVQEFMNNKGVVVTSSGMLKLGSASVEYAKEMLDDINSTIIFTSYQVNDTLGAKISQQADINGDRYVNFEGQTYKIKCQIKKVNLSAHASNNSILAIVQKLKVKSVILVHGEVANEKSFIHKVLEKRVKVYQSIDCESINL